MVHLRFWFRAPYARAFLLFGRFRHSDTGSGGRTAECHYSTFAAATRSVNCDLQR
jgi:hypothetical protein